MGLDWKKVNVKEEMTCLNLWRVVVELGVRERAWRRRTEVEKAQRKNNVKIWEAWVKNKDLSGLDNFNPAKSQDRIYKEVVGYD
jgi:hypothetical protein